MADLSVEDLEKAIKEILKGADLSSLSTKKVRKALEEKYEANLTSRKKEIDAMVMRLITENEEDEKEKEEEKEEQEDNKSESDNDDANGISDGSDAEEEPPKKKKQEKSAPAAKKAAASKPGAKRKSAGKADDSEDPVMSSIKQMDDEDLAKRLQEEESGLRTRGARRAAAAPPPKPKKRKEQDPNKKRKPSAYSRPCSLSDDLAAVVGTNEMPRPEIVKFLWTLVKERNLQDPENKQFFFCDEQLLKVFGIKRVRAFGMMKYLKKHIKNMEL